MASLIRSHEQMFRIKCWAHSYVAVVSINAGQSFQSRQHNETLRRTSWRNNENDLFGLILRRLKKREFKKIKAKKVLDQKPIDTA